MEGQKDIFAASEKERKHIESELKDIHGKIGQLTVVLHTLPD